MACLCWQLDTCCSQAVMTCSYPTHSKLSPSQAKTSRIRLGNVFSPARRTWLGPLVFPWSWSALADNEPQCLAQRSVTFSLPALSLRHITQAHLFELTVTTNTSVVTAVQITFSRCPECRVVVPATVVEDSGKRCLGIIICKNL